MHPVHKMHKAGRVIVAQVVDGEGVSEGLVGQWFFVGMHEWQEGGSANEWPARRRGASERVGSQ